MREKTGKVLFDFEPEEETEIAIYAGESVRILNEDVGEGWIEGENPRGQRGIFPKDYIELPETPSSPQISSSSKPTYDNPTDDGWFENPPNDSISPTKSYEQDNSPNSYNTSSNNTTTVAIHQTANLSTDHSNLPEDADDAVLSTFCGRYMNRFTYFVKVQAEDYILGTLGIKTEAGPADSFNIIDCNGDGPIWEPSSSKLKMKITNYCKGDSRGLLAAHLYYIVTCDGAGSEEVKRKFEHFEWLYEHFKRKFPCLIVPPLPAKVSPEENALTKQIKLLNLWAEQISNNSILQQCKALKHFLELSDAKAFKKARKLADNDKYVGGAAFKLVDIRTSDAIVGVANKAGVELSRIKRLHECVTNTLERIVYGVTLQADYSAKYISPSLQVMEGACKKLGDGMIAHKAFDTGKLGLAFSTVADIIKDINADVTTQPRIAQVDVTDKFWIHRKKLESWPIIFNVNELTIDKYKDAERLKTAKSSKCDDANFNERFVEIVKYRADRICTTTQAELNHHTTEIVKDTKAIMQEYLQRQMQYHEELADKYRRALQVFDQTSIQTYS